MNIKRAICILLGSTSAIMTLCGCSNLSTYVSDSIQIQAESKIQTRQEFLQYEQYIEDGVLDDAGTYRLTVPDNGNSASSAIRDTLVPVTFARNSFLSCTYHTNMDESLPLGSEICYLAPGDNLYVSNVVVNNVLSNLYEFSEFRIWSYDAEGKRGTKPYDIVKKNNGILLTIPHDYAGTGFAIEPLGVYSNRTVSVEAHFMNNANQSQSLDGGLWTIGDQGGQEFKDTISISPIVSYTIVFDYSNYANDYYFVSSSPQCWYSKERECKVVFQEASSHEENTTYSVLMHPYITMRVNNKCISALDSVAEHIPFVSASGKGIITAITKDNQNLLPEKPDSESLEIYKLKSTDEITIRVGKEYKITGTGVNVGTPVPLGSNADNGYEYTIIVPDTNKGIQIDITKRNSDAEGKYQGYNIANADLVLLRTDESEIKIGDELLADSEKVTVEIKPHQGYYIMGKNVEKYAKYKKTMKLSEFQTKASSIIADHSVLKYITVNLNTDDDCGTCVYKLDGEIVADNTVSARIGQKLELSFTVNSNNKIVWDGWIADKWASSWGANSITDKIEITSDLDGKTISRLNYNIITERVG